MPVEINKLNALAKDMWTALVARYPEWELHADLLDTDDIEVAVPAPKHSMAGHLIIFTSKGEDMWLRYAPPHMCYAVDDTDELLRVVGRLLADDILFVVIMKDDTWVETTLVHRGRMPDLEKLHTAQVVSWSGKYDATITG